MSVSTKLLVLATASICMSLVIGDCPPPDQIEPCTCNQGQRIQVICKNFMTGEDLREVFQRNPNWSFHDLYIENCSMPYIPSSITERALFQSLNVSWSTLYSLFDEPPKSKELNLYLKDVKFMKDVDWSILSHAYVKELGAMNTEIKKFGRKFQEGLRHDTEILWFEDTKTQKISPGAFTNLKDLNLLVLKRSSITAISRDMFPKPADKLNFLDFSSNRIETLPEDIFNDMPVLVFFNFENNLLKTLSEKIFSHDLILYELSDNPLVCDCEIKWLTTNPNISRDLVKGKCAEPDANKGKELISLTESDFSHCS